jgi:CRISPR-associated protein Csx10
MKLVMELKSDALPGSGEGLSGIIDADINYDELGIPYIPGKRIKGILKEAAEELVSAGQLSNIENLKNIPVETIFGKPGQKEGTSLKISDGRLENDNLLRKMLLFTGNNEECAHIFCREAVLNYFTYLRSQTAINQRGAAKKNSLRTSRVLKKGTKFYFDLEMPGNYEKDLKTICSVTRRFGINRTRGFGEVELKLIDDHDREERKKTGSDNSGPFQCKDDQQCRITLEIENIGQVLVTRQIGKTQSGENYIPGDTLLGALARAYIDNRKLEQAHECPGFHGIFLSGDVVFSNAYPRGDSGEVFFPAPVSLVKEKEEVNYFDIVREEDREYIIENKKKIEKGPEGFAAVDGNEVETIVVETEMEYHHRRPKDKSIGCAKKKEDPTQDDGEFFQFSVIKAGQSFQSEITGSFKHLEQVEEILKQEQVFYLGKSGTAQYGKCIVKITNFSPLEDSDDFWEQGEQLVLTLAADMILANEFGFPVPDPGLLIKELAEIWGVEYAVHAGQQKLQIKKKFLEFTRIGGFMSVWKMPKIQQTAFKAGSVLIVENNSGRDLDLNKIKNRSCGRFIEQGYGKMQINRHGKSDGEIEVTAYQQGKFQPVPEKEEFSPLREFTESLLSDRLKLLLKEKAILAAREMEKIPSGSFLGKIIAFINHSNSFNNFYEKIAQLRKKGKEQLGAIAHQLEIKGETMDQKGFEDLVDRCYSQLLSHPDLEKNLYRSGAFERGFYKKKEELYEFYQTYALYFLHQLKLKRREDE